MEADASSEGGAWRGIRAVSMRLLGTRVCLHARLRTQEGCEGKGVVSCDDLELTLAFTFSEITILKEYFLLPFKNVVLCLQSANLKFSVSLSMFIF